MPGRHVSAGPALGKCVYTSGHLPLGHLNARPRAFNESRQPHSKQRFSRRRSQTSQISSRARYWSASTVRMPSHTKSARDIARFQACLASGGIASRGDTSGPVDIIALLDLKLFGYRSPIVGRMLLILEDPRFFATMFLDTAKFLGPAIPPRNKQALATAGGQTLSGNTSSESHTLSNFTRPEESSPIYPVGWLSKTCLAFLPGSVKELVEGGS
jgi:hypothetical protein